MLNFYETNLIGDLSLPIFIKFFNFFFFFFDGFFPIYVIFYANRLKPVNYQARMQKGLVKLFAKLTYNIQLSNTLPSMYYVLYIALYLSK